MKNKYSICCLLFLSIGASSSADVTIPSVFSDHAVLQKSARTAVWRKAEPSEKVTVTLDKVSASTV